jgi:hypothetical protein
MMFLLDDRFCYLRKDITIQRQVLCCFLLTVLKQILHFDIRQQLLLFLLSSKQESRRTKAQQPCVPAPLRPLSQSLGLAFPERP